MIRIICFCLIIAGIISSSDSFAQKKRVKLHRLTVLQYDDSKVKGVLHDVTEQGIVMINAKDTRDLRFDVISKAIADGTVETTTVPFNSVKTLYVRRKGASGRGFLMGAAGAAVITGLLAVGTSTFGDGCGCGGPPAVLVLPPIAGIIGGVVGSIAGLAPRKILELDPDRLYESADSGLRKYSWVGQMTPGR